MKFSTWLFALFCLLIAVAMVAVLMPLFAVLLLAGGGTVLLIFLLVGFWPRTQEITKGQEEDQDAGS